MTNPIQRELNVGVVQFQGQQYEAVVVYNGDEACLPQAFTAVCRVNEVYRRTIQIMLDQHHFVPRSEWGSIEHLSSQGIHFQQNTVVDHANPKHWQTLIDSLNNPQSAKLPSVTISETEYGVLRRLYERLPRNGGPTLNYTDQEKALLNKLGIALVEDPNASNYSDFLYKLFAKYLDVERKMADAYHANLDVD